MPDGEGWSWELTERGRDDIEGLEADTRRRIVAKLDEICSSPWREAPDYGEPLENSPYRKIRIGQYRLSVSFDRSRTVLAIHRIKPRSGAYTADDD